MQKSYFLPDHIDAQTHRPACPKCHANMMLARVMPARMGFDLRTVECPKCDHVHEVMVETNAFGMPFTPGQRLG
jgi:DNA polymerase III alpha subunit (gram-positive type)